MTTHAAEGSGLVTRTLHPAVTTDASSFEAAARAAERVDVSLASPGPECRTKLMACVLAAIDAQLERLGAAPSSCTARDSLETILSDQLYRSRLLGKGGIALRLSALDGIADESGALSVEDSHALRRMFALAELEPLQVFLPEPSARLRVPGAPQQLSDWLPAGARAGRVASIEYEPQIRDPDRPQAAARADDLAPPELAAFVKSDDGDPLAAPQPASSASLVPPARGEPAAALARADAELSEHERPTVVPVPTPEPTLDAAAVPATAAAASPAPEAPSPTRLQAEQPPLDEEQQHRRASWLSQLQNMSGTKQHASVARVFLTSYLPLAREVATGRAPDEVRTAVETWAEGFAQGYAAAFKTMTSHARRPTMVRDIFDVGQRWLNQYRARSYQLLLIDGMRFDLGQRLNEELEARLSGSGVCRDQTLLWAALPSNSGAQRLAEATSKRTKEAVNVVAPAAGGVEHLRVGSRELFRIDRLASELAQPGEFEAQRLERLARQLADIVVPWLRARAPETLVVLFGDHGFHWQVSDRGTTAAQRGGALPEQVLVPASAWLLGTTRQKAGLAPGLH